MYIYTLFKVILLLYNMEKSDNKLTREEKGEIFEYVNDLYLKLNGQKKKQTKASFKNSWKEDNLLFIMMMKFNDVYDKWCENEQNEEWIFERENYSNEKISKKKHQRMMSMMRQNEYDMEVKLEEIKEGKGYMSEEQHKEEMEQLEKQQQEIIREKSHTIGKLRSTEAGLRNKIEAQEQRLEAQKRYYEDQISKLTSQ